jgi:hypothetical protein
MDVQPWVYISGLEGATKCGPSVGLLNACTRKAGYNIIGQRCRIEGGHDDHGIAITLGLIEPFPYLQFGWTPRYAESDRALNFGDIRRQQSRA